MIPWKPTLRGYPNRCMNRIHTTALAKLSSPTEEDKDKLLGLLNNRPGSVVDDDRLSHYNHDWTKQYRGNSRLVLRPQSTDEVSRILKYCNERLIGIVPQGGNTGLAGGSVPLDWEVILSMEKMNEIQSLEPTTGILTCEAGCILQNLLDFAAMRDHLLPVDLGAKGTCQIGGNISTNAGKVGVENCQRIVPQCRPPTQFTLSFAPFHDPKISQGGSFYFRYGSLHANVVGLEVVLANGDILNMGCDPANLKDNTGYGMKHLFIGAEGTLGIVTRVAILCPRLPSSRCTVLLACNSFDDILNILEEAKKCMGETLAAFEFMDGPVIDLVCQTGSKPLPFPTCRDCPYYLLVESHGSCAEHDRAKMDSFLHTLFDEHLVVDGIFASSYKQINELWSLREACNPSCASSGYVYKYDVSLPIPEFPNFIMELKEVLSTIPVSLDFCNWGHIIDGNLHCNIVCKDNFEFNSRLSETVENSVFHGVQKRGGSISAEHGLGQAKRKYMPSIHKPETLSKMHDIKNVFDPKGILNPGKYLQEHLPIA